MGRWDFGVSEYPIRVGDFWPVDVNRVLGTEIRLLPAPAPVRPSSGWEPATAPAAAHICLPTLEKMLARSQPAQATSGRNIISFVSRPGESRPPTWNGPRPVVRELRLPVLNVPSAQPSTSTFSQPSAHVAPPCLQYRRVPEPEPAARVVKASISVLPMGGLRGPEPEIEFTLDTPQVANDNRLRRPPSAEPATVIASPYLQLSATSFAGVGNLPKLADFAPRVTPLELAGPVDAPAPQPVLSMPSFPPFEPAFTSGPATAALPVWLPAAIDPIFGLASLDELSVPRSTAPAAQWLPASAYGPYGISMAPRTSGPVKLHLNGMSASAATLSLESAASSTVIPKPLAFLPDRPGVTPIPPELSLPGVKNIHAAPPAAHRLEVAEAMPSAPAMPVWSMPTFPLLPCPDALAYEAREMRLALAAGVLSPILVSARPELAEPEPSAPAMPVWSMPTFEQLPCPNAIALEPAELRLPAFDAVAGRMGLSARPELCPSEPSLPAMPVLSMPSFEFVLQPMAAAVEPAAIRLQAFSLTVRPVFGQELSPNRPVAEPTAAAPQPAGFSFHPRPIEAVLPVAVPLSGPGRPGFCPATPLAPPAEAPPPVPVESMPRIPAFAPMMLTVMPAAQLPQVPVPTVVKIAAAGFGKPYPEAATPEARELTGDAAVLELMSGLKVHGMELPSAHREPLIPQPSFIPIEFYCQRGLVMPQRQLFWKTRSVPAFPPDFSLKVVVDRTEDAAPWKPVPKPPPPRKVEIPDIAKRRAANNRWSQIIKIAACLLLAVVGWIGIRELRLNMPSGMAGTETASASMPNQAPLPAPQAGGGAPSGSAPAPAQATGAMATVRRAIANRAAVSVGDSLQAGMEAWGAGPKGWAPGWSRNPDGFVHPGPLAIFQPSQSFKDYRLEFFGQIEDKSMGWVVRAKDKQNFYAMKFTVVEPGLRPIIAMAHYPVVGGVKGHKVEAPLSVMVHNNTPFHVAVDVQGNRVTASIEGQEVDSWTDDLLPAGGVGFFAEAGEKARLYWMKVSKNQDWLGSVCAYLSGGSREVAEVWGPGIPANAPQPNAPSRPEEFVVAETDTSLDDFSSSPVRARTLNYGRIRSWNS